jgi:enoyl-CoA hydratase
VLNYHSEGPIAWATINRPEKLNAMTRSFWQELRDVLAEAERDENVRVLIFTGAGRSFSVGGDIVAFGELNGAADKRAYLQEAFGALRAVETFTKPTIAAVHGHCMGGGCELTIVCGRGAAHVNLHWLKLMVFSGEVLGAHEALVAGLVNRITQPGQHVDAAETLARKIALKAPLALTVSKQVINRQYSDGYDHALDAVAYLQATEDFAEGIEAFRDRRKPEFRGR